MPVGVNSSGGAALDGGDSNDNKIIMISLGSDDNENAFQQGIGLGQEMSFENSDPAVRGLIIGRLRQIFRQFEALRRFRLFASSVTWGEDPETQELLLTFKYLSLETDEVNTFRRTFGAEALNG